MSADLFEAFVGPHVANIESKSPARESPSKLLVQTDDLSHQESTWQSWPTTARVVSKQPSEHQSPSLWETDQDGKDVLFDASQIGVDQGPLISDEDFGEFEEVATKRSDEDVSRTKPLSTTLDLLDFDGTRSEPVTSAHVTESQPRASGSSSKFAPAVGRSARLFPGEPTTIPGAEQEDEWGDFETIEVPDTTTGHTSRQETLQQPTQTTPQPQSQSQPLSAEARPAKRLGPTAFDIIPESPGSHDPEEEPWDDLDDVKAENTASSNRSAASLPQQNLAESVLTTDSVQRSRPTNMPPPAVLLAWLPIVFSALASQARQPNADPMVGIAAVQAYRVSARVIAGRAARWKRDTILAQGMRIGVAGRSGGMKLTALDRGEGRKEDQAAEDVITSWTRFSHVLNAAIAKAKIQRPPMALSVKLTARPATGLDVLSAPHICAACGLRRNERVIGIDVSVSDTFGEFWIEHWGHKDCADTWYRFNNLLDQR